MRKYYSPTIGSYKGKIGELVGVINYSGCTTGWHTLQMRDGTQIMMAGNEIRVEIYPIEGET
jgi:hypothetical protein